jgi:hypothetical protein
MLGIERCYININIVSIHFVMKTYTHSILVYRIPVQVHLLQEHEWWRGRC